VKRLTLLLILLLVALLAVAGPARAFVLPLAPSMSVTVTDAEEEGESEEDDEGEEESGEEAEEEESSSCEEEPDEEAEEACEIEEEELEEDEECLLEDASATLTTSPGANQVKLVLRYHSFEPTAVALDTHLRGGKGSLYLGADRARFRRQGVFHDSFKLADKQMTKALAAREFRVDMRAAGTPGYCALHLVGRHGSSRSLRSS
jgi:hypothetical protein